jgi:hypothetical protein
LIVIRTVGVIDIRSVGVIVIRSVGVIVIRSVGVIDVYVVSGYGCVIAVHRVAMHVKNFL